MRSLRLSLLALVAGVLRRWLDAVTAQIAPAAEPPAPPNAPADTRPAPPDHWVELVRQHAPQLLDSEATGNANVIDWRSDEEVMPAPVAPTRKVRPLRLQTPQQRPAAPPTVTSAPRRPLRMEQIVAQPLDAGEIHTQAGRTDTPEIQPPLRSTRPGDAPRVNLAPPNVPDPLPFPRRGPADTPAQPIREVSLLPDDSEAVTAHFANTPVERQRVRETYPSLPPAAAVPTIRTRPSASLKPTQRHAEIPPTPQVPPPQIVLRPTITPAPLNVEDVSPDRWPSLPDEPPEAVRDSSSQQRRERLRREQEGRSWSE